MKFKYIISLLMFMAGFISCDNNDEIILPSRTVLVYMVESNLKGPMQDNIKDMMKVATRQNLNGGNLLIYYSDNNKNGELFQIKEGDGGIISRHHIRDYNNQSGIDPNVMNRVIKEAFTEFPADNYGLVLSSHGTSWLSSDYNSMLRSFGEEDGENMEIYELNSALQGFHFDFILFDACYMSSIEVAYELRDKADYMIGSSTEVLGDGFPYHKFLPTMFQKTPDLKMVCESFYNHYNEQSGLYRSASVALINTKELEELAAVTREILQGKEQDILVLPIEDIQPLDYLDYDCHLLFDFEQFISHVANSQQYNTYMEKLNKVITYKSSTPRATYGIPSNDPTLEIKYYSGMSTYIPQKAYVRLNHWYSQLEWYKAVY